MSLWQLRRVSHRSFLSILMLQKFELSITPVMSNSLQILTSDQGVFSFKSHSTNSEKFSIIQNACIKQLSDIFQILIDQGSQILKQFLQLKQLTGNIGQDKRSVLEMVFGPSTSSIRQKGFEKGPFLLFFVS